MDELVDNLKHCLDFFKLPEIEKEENIPKFTHTPLLSFIETANFRLLVDPDRLQISMAKMNEENIKNLPKISEKYISQLPETPYTAIGLNYTYNIEPKTESLNQIFSPNKSKFKKLFSENYQLGGIIIFNYKKFVANFNLKPSFPEGEKSIANFNFHCDSKDVEEIKKKIKSYSEMREKTKEILKGMFDE